MNSTIFFIVIINSFYYLKKSAHNRTQSTSEKTLICFKEKRRKIITIIQLQSKTSMPANILDFLQKLAMYFAPKTQQLGPQDGN